jgi:hypothetical protein
MSQTNNLPAELLNWPVELLQIVEPDKAEELSTLSWDTIKRNHPEKVVHLSKRRVGMRVGHALMLGTEQRIARQQRSRT